MKVHELVHLIRTNPGKTQREMANLAGMTLSEFVGMIRRNNIRWTRSGSKNYLKHKDYLKKFYGVKSTRQMSRELKVTQTTVRNYLLDNRLIPESETGLFTVYKDGEYVGEGTLYEMSDLTGLAPSVLRWYSMIDTSNRSVDVVKVGEDDEITG